MKKCYIVTTYADYTIICLAGNEKTAIKKADKYYLDRYGENRADWNAYELNNYLTEYDNLDVMAVRAWVD